MNPTFKQVTKTRYVELVAELAQEIFVQHYTCLLYTSPTKPTAPSESHFGGGGSLTFIYTLNGAANYSTSCRAA